MEIQYRITNEKLDAWKSWLLEQEKSRCTVEKYLRDVQALCRFLPEHNTVTKAAMIAWKEHLKSRYTVRSVNSMLVAANNFLSFCGWDSLRVKTCKFQREVYSDPSKELTKGEYLRLLKAAQGNPRLRLLLETICATGIRVSELQFFTVEAVKRGKIMVNCKNKTRNILVPGSLRKKLMQYTRANGIHSGVVFRTRSGRPLNRSNIWAEMKNLCRKAQVSKSKVFPHNLRKLFARSFYDLDKDIAKLADVLGHSSIETTRIYIVTTGSEHMRRIEELGLVV